MRILRSVIVQEPYLSGHWKGGKAIIEFARDLSYTVVSIYDKQGTRQRIYSVRTSFSEHVQQLKETASAPVPVPVPVPETAPPETRPAPQPETPPPTPSVTSNSTRMASATKGVEPKTSYEWDESKGAYVPLAVSATVSEPAAEAETQKPVYTHPENAGTPSAAPSHEERTVVAKVPAKAAPPANDYEEVWVRVTPRPSQSSASKVKVDSTTWVERTAETPKPEYRLVKRRRRHPKVKPPVEATAVASAPNTQIQNAEPAAKPPVPVVAMANAPAVEETPLHPSPVAGGMGLSEVSKEPSAPAPRASVPAIASSAPIPPAPSAAPVHQFRRLPRLHQLNQLHHLQRLHQFLRFPLLPLPRPELYLLQARPMFPAPRICWLRARSHQDPIPLKEMPGYPKQRPNLLSPSRWNLQRLKNP